MQSRLKTVLAVPHVVSSSSSLEFDEAVRIAQILSGITSITSRRVDWKDGNATGWSGLPRKMIIDSSRKLDLGVAHEEDTEEGLNSLDGGRQNSPTEQSRIGATV